jgi:hypothetical protein
MAFEELALSVGQSAEFRWFYALDINRPTALDYIWIYSLIGTAIILL